MATSSAQIRDGCGGNRELKRYSDVSAANTQLSLTTTVGRTARLDRVQVKYSANVTKDVTVTVDSGKGSAYDTLLATVSLVAVADGVFIPDQRLLIMDDDAIVVVAPAGGSGVTATIAVYLEEVV